MFPGRDQIGAHRREHFRATDANVTLQNRCSHDGLAPEHHKAPGPVVENDRSVRERQHAHVVWQHARRLSDCDVGRRSWISQRMGDYLTDALHLLGPSSRNAAERSRRIYGVYAALYLEEPLLHAWCGLASFVGRKVHRVLEVGTAGLFDGFLAEGNMAIYRNLVPELLCFRAGNARQSRLSVALEQLRRADTTAATNQVEARALADDALGRISEIEQCDVVQPVYDRVPEEKQLVLAKQFAFRLGADTAGPVLKFTGKNPANAGERMAFVRGTVLPHWQAWTTREPERVRADVTRLWREAGAPRLPELPKLSELPA